VVLQEQLTRMCVLSVHRLVSESKPIGDRQDG